MPSRAPSERNAIVRPAGNVEPPRPAGDETPKSSHTATAAAIPSRPAAIPAGAPG